METTVTYRGYIGIMENTMETPVTYRGYIGIMENKMETTIVYIMNDLATELLREDAGGKSRPSGSTVAWKQKVEHTAFARSHVRSAY